MDRWAKLRAALDAAQPGPWTADADGFGLPAVRSGEGTVAWEIDRDTDAEYIAAASPSEIRQLLAERDRFLAACMKRGEGRDWEDRASLGLLVLLAAPLGLLLLGGVLVAVAHLVA